MHEEPQTSAGTAGRPVFARDDAERAAACALSALVGVGVPALDLLRKAFGSLAAAAARGGREAAKVPDLRADAAESLAAAPDLERRGAWLLAKARELGARVIVDGDPDYPKRLAEASSRPPVIYVLGEWRDEAQRVAVVGSRASDGYGMDRACAVVDRLCAAGIEVVSGGAEGVDTKAHERALALGGRTIAVVGTGLLGAFPAKNRQLFGEIARKGALVSEFALDAGGQRTHFPQRNRTMAALSDAVVFTRGTLESGALSTCEAARRLDRPVFAVPGMVGDAQAAGPNALLQRRQARASLDGSEVVAALGLSPVSPAAPPTVARDAERALAEKPRRVLELLGPAPKHVDELATAAELTTGETLAALLSLEVAGLCAARPGMYFSRR